MKCPILKILFTFGKFKRKKNPSFFMLKDFRIFLMFSCQAWFKEICTLKKKNFIQGLLCFNDMTFFSSSNFSFWLTICTDIVSFCFKSISMLFSTAFSSITKVDLFTFKIGFANYFTFNEVVCKHYTEDARVMISFGSHLFFVSNFWNCLQTCLLSLQIGSTNLGKDALGFDSTRIIK